MQIDSSASRTGSEPASAWEWATTVRIPISRQVRSTRRAISPRLAMRILFHKILIANRGEIALRVLRTCREMGIRTVVAHAQADAGSLPVRLADESICIGPAEARQSYLNIPSIISAASITDSEAIHPGYGLLSENAAFAEICRACGIAFIGPAPEAIRLMGDKAQARAMAFGSSELYLEKFVEEARHVEVQVLGDRNGIRLHLGERDCSVQRRHQKLLEESPACAISDETRAGLYKAALTVANAVNYVSAGTVEFLVASDGSFYFIEMNTRIQVEHPITEMLTGIDIVREQVRIASGEPLGYKQKDVEFRGHAIECRVNAEDPEHFIPSPGTVTAWLPPGGPGVRVDSHMMRGAVVTPFYDSLIAKIIVHGRDRAEAISRMYRALTETVVEGVKTTIPYHLKLLADPAFLSGDHTLPRLEVS